MLLSLILYMELSTSRYDHKREELKFKRVYRLVQLLLVVITIVTTVLLTEYTLNKNKEDEDSYYYMICTEEEYNKKCEEYDLDAYESYKELEKYIEETGKDLRNKLDVSKLEIEETKSKE